MYKKELNQTVFETIFHSKSYGNFKIIEDLGIINNRRFVKIKFIDTGYESDVRYDIALTGMVRDPYYPKIFNIGYTGNVSDIKKLHKKAYDRWFKMISRCYNPDDKDYKNYGAIGVTVDPRWHSFENYINDIQHLQIHGNQDPNFDLFDYQVDKDYLQMDIPKGQRIYSKDTCILMNPRDNANLKLIDNSKFKVNNYFGVYKSSNYYYPSIMHNGIKYNLGIYDNEIAAANAYNYYYKFLNSQNNISINTINDVPYMSYEEFSKHNKRKLICPVCRLK